MSVFSPAGSGGLPPPTIVTTPQGDSSPTIVNISISLANTEQSYSLPASTNHFMMKLRGSSSDLKFSYSSGTSGSTYFTVPKGNFISVAGIDNGATITLYFQTPVPSQILEVMSWAV